MPIWFIRQEVALSERGGDPVFWQPGDEAEFTHMPSAKEKKYFRGVYDIL
jgi:hypothetical protein